MIYEVDGCNRAELVQALMACVMLAGGEHVLVSQMALQTGHLDSREIAAFSAELKKYSEDHPMADPTNRLLLLRIISQMDLRCYHSVVIIEQDGKAMIMASSEPCYFDEILETRDEAVADMSAAPSKFGASVEKFRGAQATINLYPA